MDCKKQINLNKCTCTYLGCPRKGLCCECLNHHLGKRQLPACCFPKDIEAEHDRSFGKFVEAVQEGKI